MADIAQKADLIRHAKHGLDVREALASGIEVMNTEVENTTASQNQVEQDFSNIKAGEETRQTNETARVANEETRQANEAARVEAENTRIASEVIREKIINNFKSFGDYSPDTTYNQYNTVTHNYSTYMCIVDGTEGIEPTPTGNSNWICLAVKGQDGTGGDMYKLYYDPDGDNIIDLANNSNKLGGNLPEYFEKKGEVNGIPVVDTDNPDANYTLKYDKKLGKLRLVPFDYVIDNTPPGAITNFVVLIGDAKLTLSWANPTDEDFAGVKIIRKEGGYPENITDGTQVYEGTGTSYVDEGLTNDTEYFYKAFTYDTSYNYNDATAGQQVSGMPKLNADVTPPGAITNFVVDAGNAKVDLSWANPMDEDFAGVKILRQTVGYPTTENDGVEVYNGSGTTFQDTTVENDTTYYYRAFPYDTAGNYNTTTEGQQISIKPVGYKVYGVRIDTTNSNPQTAVTYTDDAVNMQAGSSEWDNLFPFNIIKPCLLKAGVIQYYLNPNDFTKKEDGSAADITSGNDGDVMIEIPKIAYMIYTEGNYVYVKITDAPDAKSIDSRFCYYAHTRSSEGDRNKLYIGAYLGSVDADYKIRSLSGQQTKGNSSPSYYREHTHLNGSGYDCISFYPYVLLQCLFLIRYKNLNSQATLGMGRVNEAGTINTGGTETNGMNFGTTDSSAHMKFLGIEDLWGNDNCFLEGIYKTTNESVSTSFTNFNDNGSGYTSRGTLPMVGGGYISKVVGNSELGFLPVELNGSSSTYFCDKSYISDDLAAFGDLSSNAISGDGGGLFGLGFSINNDIGNACNRLMYL